MTQFQNKSFSVTVGTPQYREGWEACFGGNKEFECFAGEHLDEDPEPAYCGGETDLVASAFRKGYDAGFAASTADYERRTDTLHGFQRRQKEWAEHNFPLKVTAEHRRKAGEFMAREMNIAHDSYLSDRLAYLAAGEGRRHRPLIGALEELGELCHAHLKNEQGIRGTPEEHLAAKKDAIGDTLIYLLQYCSDHGFSMQECLDTAWAETSSRDWVKFPTNGRTE